MKNYKNKQQLEKAFRNLYRDMEKAERINQENKEAMQGLIKTRPLKKVLGI